MKWLCSWAVAAWIGLAIGFTARAETWTNLAGHVVTAGLVAIEGEQVLLQATNGRTWRVPLASLKPADRQRARDQAGTEPLPNDLKIPLEQAQNDLNRAAQFRQGGKITAEDYTSRCQKIKDRFEHLAQKVLKDRGEQTNTALLQRLKRRLDQSEQSAEAVLPPPRKPGENR